LLSIRRPSLSRWLPELPNDSQNDFFARSLTDQLEPCLGESIERQGALGRSERPDREEEPDDRRSGEIHPAEGGEDARGRGGDLARMEHSDVGVGEKVVEQGTGGWVLGAGCWGQSFSLQYPVPST